ncbi:hypothetical protein BG30_00300 [Bacillus subtilis subsp. subtilis]|nr:hypothetical protein BG30_00300 [Bacillus subtilis subsp. subtilis]
MNLRQLSEHVYQCEFELDVPLCIPVDINENIDSGSIIDQIKPTLICSSHGEEILYNEELYKNYVVRYRD